MSAVEPARDELGRVAYEAFWAGRSPAYASFERLCRGHPAAAERWRRAAEAVADALSDGPASRAGVEVGEGDEP